MLLQVRVLGRSCRLSSVGCILSFALSVLILTLGFRLFQAEKKALKGELLQHDDNVISQFDGFNNETGMDHFIVPNIIHLIRFNQSEFTFLNYMCLQAAYHHHGPDFFYIHTNVKEGFRGKYWSLIEEDVILRPKIKIFYVEPPSEIFGQPLNPKWRLWHGGDIARIRIMMKYGGIFLDNDVFVIQNLDKYRKFEIAMNWDEWQSLATQVIVAHKDARFLPLWLDAYHEYHPDLWYYNAGERPTQEILEKHPELLHRVKVQFGADLNISYSLYTKTDYNWRSLDTVHLLTSHAFLYDPNYNMTPVYDEENIKTNNYIFGEMLRELLDLCCSELM